MMLFLRRIGWALVIAFIVAGGGLLAWGVATGRAGPG